MRNVYLFIYLLIYLFIYFIYLLGKNLSAKKLKKHLKEIKGLKRNKTLNI